MDFAPSVEQNLKCPINMIDLITEKTVEKFVLLRIRKVNLTMDGLNVVE